jgi:hypothetical protein
MGPLRRRLIVRTFEPKPSTYRAKVTGGTQVTAPIDTMIIKPVRPAKPATIRPPSPGADRKPTTLETQRERKRARLDALKWLKQQYPALFDTGMAVKPLAIGVGKQIVAAAIESGRWPSRGAARDALSAALHYRTGSIGYLEVLTVPCVWRYGLDGEPVEPVSEEHQAEARKLLEARREGPRSSPQAEAQQAKETAK